MSEAEFVRVCLGLGLVLIGSVGVFFFVRLLMRRFDEWLLGEKDRNA